MSALLSLESVGKSYGKSMVLEMCSLAVTPGEFVVLIGGSGSGKTTLLRLVAGLARTDTGSIFLRGVPVDDRRTGCFMPPERRRLGMVFQDYALWPHLTCLQNVEAAIRDTNANKRGEAMAILDRVGMAQYADVRPQRLSGGEQQRVGVARALASKPDLLLFDEALSSLDVDIRERMRLEIRELAHETGAAALFVSHDPLDAWRLADRVAVLEGGRLTQTATPAELYASPTTARVARFIGAVGGFAMETVSDGGQVGIRFAGRFCAARHHKVEPGERGIIYVRPEGVRRVLDGIPAELEFSTFEAGQHRAYWRIVGTDATVCSLEQAPPTGHAATLSIASEHLLIYPENGVL
ncbi:MAG: ABC transporter ATP-binding protein [Terriglobia bacterium]|nr:ABC transporter ATP-binding protein [Terriglobia bacterium]